MSKGSTSSRGYGNGHRRIRKTLLPFAYGTPCVKCGEPMLLGQDLDLDHNDKRTEYIGFAHSSCNRKAGGKKGIRALKAKRRQVIVQRKPIVVDRW